jgi:hypothetical protein
VGGAAGDAGEYSSIAIDAAGRSKVVYYDAANGDLLLAE